MSDNKHKLPDYLAEGEGYIDITLHSPAKLGGVSAAQLRMREPTVNDLKIVQTGKGDEGEREAKLFANLCEITPEDLGALTLRNYKRLGEAFGVFTD